MKLLRVALRNPRAILRLVLALSLPVLATQCKTAGGNYQNIEYDPATLNTPSGHGMEKKDYPFDDDGKYRKDWVRDNARGTTASSRNLAPPAGATTVAEPDATPSNPDGGYLGPASPGVAPPAPAPESAPAPVASAPEPRYHKVVSGDTLFSLSSRYGTSVSELKRVNGLSSDSIRVGQSLRIP